MAPVGQDGVLSVGHPRSHVWGGQHGKGHGDNYYGPAQAKGGHYAAQGQAEARGLPGRAPREGTGSGEGSPLLELPAAPGKLLHQALLHQQHFGNSWVVLLAMLLYEKGCI